MDIDSRGTGMAVGRKGNLIFNDHGAGTSVGSSNVRLALFSDNLFYVKNHHDLLILLKSCNDLSD